MMEAVSVFGKEKDIEYREREKELLKSRVRRGITYGAATFLFGGGFLLIVYLAVLDDKDGAVAVFNTLLPVASAIIAFWFSGRNVAKDTGQDGPNPDQNLAPSQQERE